MSGKILLCINSDDFGFSSPISSGILALVERGLISSLSVMPLHCEKDDSEKLYSLKNISVGLHFSLTSGNNRFAENAGSPYRLAWNIFSGKTTKEQIREELLFQLGSLRNIFSGNITHIDTHQHIHILPVVANTMKELAAEKNISYVRIAKESSPAISVKKLLYNSFNQNNYAGFPVFGLNLMGKSFTRKNIMHQFAHLKMKSIPKAMWIVHPGYASDKKNFPDSYNDERENEMKILEEMESEIKNFAEIVPLTNLL